MKNLVKLSIFALALGFFASCGDTAPKDGTTVDAPADTTTAAPEATAPVADTAKPH